MPKSRKKHCLRRLQSVPAVLHSPQKARRKKWTDSQMMAAMDAIKKGLSMRRAAEEHRSTLEDRILGNVVHGTKPGPKQYLNQVQEEELSEYIVIVGKI